MFIRKGERGMRRDRRRVQLELSEQGRPLVGIMDKGQRNRVMTVNFKILTGNRSTGSPRGSLLLT